MLIQLLCTFTQENELQDTLNNIHERYQLVYNYIYVLQNADILDDLYVTYNIINEFDNHLPLKNTILVHRKKESNTLYTINALNMLVKEENNGKLDKRFGIEWNKFKNMIILTNLNQTRKIKTKIFKIIDIS